MSFDVQVTARTEHTGSMAGARRVTAAGFAAQGAAVAAVSTTVPAVTEHLRLTPLVTTAMIVMIALMAGGGSFAGLVAIRRLGLVATMRVAVLAVALALLLISWAPGQPAAWCGYALFGIAVGALDVSANTRAAAIERGYGRSIFASFYAVWSVAGVVAALVTAGTTRLGWPVAQSLTAQAALVLVLAACIRTHALPASKDSPVAAAQKPLGRGVWVRLIPFGLVLLMVYVVDSTVSAWSAVYLRQTLAASLAVAPLAYAAYQIGTVVGRTCADRLVQTFGPAAIVRVAILLTAGAMASLAAAPSWPVAVLAACFVGLGTAAMAPLCLAAAGRMRPDAAEAVLARLNLFNYVGVLIGGAISGILGSTGRFRLAYAAPAALVVLLLVAAHHFTQPVPTRAVLSATP